MADTFRNPYNYTSPIGAALADLARTVISGPSRAEKIKAAEEMLKVKRANENLLKAQTIIGTPGYDPNAFASAALGAGISGGDLGDYGLFTQDPNAAWDDPALNNAFIRAGGAPSSTAGAFLTGEQNEMTRAANALAQDESQFGRSLAATNQRHSDALATDRWKFANTPFEAIGPDGPQVFTNLTAPGQPAITSETDMKGYLLGENFGNLGALPPAEQTVLGARGTGNGPRAKMYTLPDGTRGRTFDDMTDAVTGAPLPGDALVGDAELVGTDFTNTELAKHRESLIQRRVAVEDVIGQVNELDRMLASPNAGAAVGIIGSGAGIINNLASQVEAGLQLAGIDTPPEVRDILTYQSTFRSLGVDNAQIQSALIDLAYTVADAREGGQKSVEDVNNALRTIGANLGDPVAMRTVLRKAAERAVRGYQASENIFRGVYGDKLNLPEAQFSPVSGVAPAPAASAARPRATNPTTGEVVEWDGTQWTPIQ